MKLSYKYLGFVVPVVAVAFFVNKGDEANKQKQDELVMQEPSSEVSLDRGATDEQISQRKSVDHIPQQDSEVALTPQLSEQQIKQQKAASFLQSQAFGSVAGLNNSFVRDDGSVSMESLSHSFAIDDFGQVIDKIDKLESDEQSALRESQLSARLYDTFGADMYDEQYSCSGDICAVTFKSADQVSEQNITQFSEFAENYTFTNHSKSEAGEAVVKMVFIATDNPSELTVW